MAVQGQLPVRESQQGSEYRQSRSTRWMRRDAPHHMVAKSKTKKLNSWYKLYCNCGFLSRIAGGCQSAGHRSERA
eukprot:3032397-Rhodomonas_salina.1